jgi:hypothetical protein
MEACQCDSAPGSLLWSPFAGRFVIIDFSLSNCIHSQVGKIAVLIDYQRNYMQDYLKEWASANSGSAEVTVQPPGVVLMPALLMLYTRTWPI